MDHNLFREAFKGRLISALLPDIKVADVEIESPIFSKICASSTELNCSGINSLLITEGGKL